LPAAQDRAQRDDHISTRSRRPALPVRGSAKSTKQAANPSMRASNRRVLNAAARCLVPAFAGAG
jgi:hypothetical protein